MAVVVEAGGVDEATRAQSERVNAIGVSELKAAEAAVGGGGTGHKAADQNRHRDGPLRRPLPGHKFQSVPSPQKQLVMAASYWPRGSHNGRRRSTRRWGKAELDKAPAIRTFLRRAFGGAPEWPNFGQRSRDTATGQARTSIGIAGLTSVTQFNGSGAALDNA
jgi:hypothetical protein